MPILEGGIDYLQGAIVKCWMPAMASSVTEAQSHDEGICIRVEEVQETLRECNGDRTKVLLGIWKNE